MRKICMAFMAAFILFCSWSLSQAEGVSGSGPDTSRFIMQLDSELNFRVNIVYSDVAGGVAKSTIYIMIAFQQGEKCIAYDVLPIKIESAQSQEVMKDGKGEGSLEFSVVLSKYTDVKDYDDIIEIRLFLVDAEGKKTRSKSLKFDADKKNYFRSWDKLEI